MKTEPRLESGIKTKKAGKSDDFPAPIIDISLNYIPSFVLINPLTS